VDLRVSPEKRAAVEEALATNGISHVVFIDDLHARVQESRQWLSSPNRYLEECYDVQSYKPFVLRIVHSSILFSGSKLLLFQPSVLKRQ
jgi:hypothetical protein